MPLRWLVSVNRQSQGQPTARVGPGATRESPGSIRARSSAAGRDARSRNCLATYGCGTLVVAALALVPASGQAQWQLGEPDLELRVENAHPLTGAEGDYRNFVLPTGLTETRWVTAIELAPGLAEVVHHATILLDDSGRARAAESADEGPGYDGLMLDHGAFPDGHFLRWAPGLAQLLVPPAMAWTLPPGADVILQLHFRPDADPVPVVPAVGLQFAERPPTFSPVTVTLTSKTIDLEPGVAATVVVDRFRLPVAVDLRAAYPHAHHLGKEVTATATLPDGREIPLLRVDDWSVDWQRDYRFARPVHLPADTILAMRFTFDNSADNPRNPHRPPQRVRYGRTSEDEMAEVRLQVVPSDANSLAVLRRSVAVKAIRVDILGHQARLRTDPQDHQTMVALAARYLDIGQVDLAVEQLETAIEIEPESPQTHYTLGATLTAGGRTEEAVAAYRRALQIRPDYAEAHNNLGGVLESLGQRDDAVGHYRLALRFDPTNANAHYNLGLAMQVAGDPLAAAEHYREALRHRPADAQSHSNLARVSMELRDYALAVDHYSQALSLDPQLADALVDLSWLRATAPRAELRDPVEALDLITQAASRVGSDHPLVLDVRAAAYAENGQFDLAAATARRAADQARSVSGLEPLATAIEGRMSLYLMYRPYRLPTATPEP